MSGEIILDLNTIILCITISCMLIALIKEWFLPEFTVFLALSILILTGILSVGEGLSGFSNSGVHTLAFLFIIGSAISKSGILHELIQRILKPKKSLSHILFHLMLPVSSLSALMNNTPIVTMLIPTLQNWAISNNIKPSKLMIPLSYATILGGTITLIGTSTNLIVHGLLLEKGLEGFRFFDFTIFGIPLTLAGIIYFVFIGKGLLPNRSHNREKFEDEQHHSIHMFVVDKGSLLIGKTIQEAMLRNLNQLYLFKIIRNEKAILPAPNDEIIQCDDILVFSGDLASSMHINEVLGLKPYTGQLKHEKFNHATLYEVSISHNSPLINKKIKDSHFRSRYNAAIVAVKRKGNQITSGIGNIVIKPGDILLLLAKNDFIKSWVNSEDFHFISPVIQSKKVPWHRKVFTFGVLIIIMLTPAFQLLSTFEITLIATVVLILTKLLTVTEAFKAINWNVIILMASSIGIGKAIDKTGLAQTIASILIEIQSSLGVVGVLVLFYLTTLIITEVLNNVAAAALMFPIGYSLSIQLNTDPMMFAMITAIAASCSFLTPIGYQTNMLVYGPGGYRFTDYFKVGFPLSLICMSLTILIAYLKWL